MGILVLGSVAIDKIESPFGNSEKILGGSATHIALSSSFLSKDINILGIVGNDFPEEYMNLLKKFNVNTEGIKVHPTKKTFFWHGKYHLNMNTRDTIEVQLNSMDEDFYPEIPEKYQKCNYLILGNISPKTQLDVISKIKKRPKFVVLDTMDLWINIAKDDLISAISKVDLFCLNDSEARLLSGEVSLLRAAKKILNYGCKYLIIKKGEHGALLFDKTRLFHFPAMLLEVVNDPTGAGDSFIGGIVSFLSKNKKIDFDTIKLGIVHGTIMASFWVEKFGAEIVSSLNMDKINKREKELLNLISFKKVNEKK